MAGFRALRRVLALLVRVRVPLPVVLAEVRVPGTICIDEERALAGRGAMRERRGRGREADGQSFEEPRVRACARAALGRLRAVVLDEVLFAALPHNFFVRLFIHVFVDIFVDRHLIKHEGRVSAGRPQIGCARCGTSN